MTRRWARALAILGLGLAPHASAQDLNIEIGQPVTFDSGTTIGPELVAAANGNSIVTTPGTVCPPSSTQISGLASGTLQLCLCSSTFYNQNNVMCSGQAPAPCLTRVCDVICAQGYALVLIIVAGATIRAQRGLVYFIFSCV
jgi:hypothetical protein